MARIVVDKECSTCTTMMIGVSSNKQYCTECYQEKARIRSMGRYNEECSLMRCPKQCEICGEALNLARGKIKYCSTCRPEAYKAKNLQIQRDRNAAIRAGTFEPKYHRTYRHKKRIERKHLNDLACDSGYF